MALDLNRVHTGNNQIDAEDHFKAVLRMAGTDAANPSNLSWLLDVLGVVPLAPNSDLVEFKSRFKRWKFYRRASRTKPTAEYRRQLRDEFRQRESARKTNDAEDACSICKVSGHPDQYPCRLPDGSRSRRVHANRARRWGLNVQ